ncbi:MAG: hypothetical protein QM788_15250 [Roseateles sp.]|uniref:hypothetical protein n=1 Tax=Roseateles sp. TaxID=1971397 RepID=UPI0039EB2170
MERRPSIPARKARRLAGLTLVETLVAVLVLGVLVAVAAPSMADFMERRRIAAAAGELLSLFNYAKAETNALAANGELNLHLEPVPGELTSCARLATASIEDTCTCTRPATTVCQGGRSSLVREFILPRDTGVRFDAAAVKWGLHACLITFYRSGKSGLPEGPVVTVTGERTGARLRVEYNNVGRVRICAPDGFSGYPVCDQPEPRGTCS